MQCKRRELIDFDRRIRNVLPNPLRCHRGEVARRESTVRTDR